MKAMRTLMAAAVAALAFAAIPAAAVDFHGYIRTGVGGSGSGGKQQCFAAPGEIYKFRLGNECETYGEAEFTQVLYKDKSGLEFSYDLMLALVSSNNDGSYMSFNSGGNDIALRQAWVGARVPQLGNTLWWIGNRYFQRHDVHMIDFFWWNPSGPGAGVEDLALGFGKAAVTVFQSRNGDRQLWRGDLRIYGIDIGLGSLAFGYNPYIDSPPPSSAPSPNREEFSHQLNGMWDVALLGGRNVLGLQWGNGSAAGIDNGINWNGGTQSKQWRIVEDLAINPSSSFSIGAVATYADYKQRYSVDPANLAAIWNSASAWGLGARPIYHVSDIFSLAVDLGYNSVKPKEGTDKSARTLFKVTPALILHPPAGPGGAYFTRPELRVFLTYAVWNDAAQRSGMFNQTACTTGGTSTGPYGCDKNGLTFGAQVESWW